MVLSEAFKAWAHLSERGKLVRLQAARLLGIRGCLFMSHFNCVISKEVGR